MTPASPTRCHGSPSTSASSWGCVSDSVVPASLGYTNLPLVEPACGKPHADAVVHEHLHAIGSAIGSAVGEQVRVVRVSSAEGVYASRQRGFGAGSHVQWFGSQPDGADADHLSSSRSQPAHRADAAKGQVTLTVDAPRRSSIRSSSTTAGATGAIATGMKVAISGVRTWGLSPTDCRRHL